MKQHISINGFHLTFVTNQKQDKEWLKQEQDHRIDTIHQTNGKMCVNL
jgi:hypothetical protein